MEKERQKKSRFSLEDVHAVADKAAQQMKNQTTNNENTRSDSDKVQIKTKNTRGAGRKPVLEQAKNKITVNLTDTELKKLQQWCRENGMKPASTLRYCLTKVNVL